MTLRIAVLADLGQDTYHAGDEAMGHAAADELRSRGLQVLMLSRNPEQTQRLFGLDAAPALAFPWPPAEREDYLRRIQAHLAGSAELPAGDPALGLISELGKCDGLVIAGGGNLNSRYGWLLYERAAVVAIARSLNMPVVVSGQTLGPQLSAEDTVVLADLLRAAELTSVREQSSAELARRIGVPAVRGVDDASFLSVGRTFDPPESRYVAVTISPLSGSMENLYALLGAELDALHRRTGLPALFLPHVGIGDEDGWDNFAHARIAESMSSPFRLMPVLTARETAALTAGASLIVTSRYHPVVFGLSHSVPVVGLAVDEYSAVRLKGVAANWGLEDFVLPLPGLQEGLLSPALAEVWERREEVSAHLSTVLPARNRWSKQWWDGVTAVFSDRAVSGPPQDLPPAPVFRAAGQWAAAARALGQKFYAQSAMAAQSEAEEDRLGSYLAQAHGELASLRDEHRRLLNSRTVKTALSLHRLYAKLLRR
ncbi:polysaccharide pyruvyl transferase family protein [Arthrobacter sp. 08Y14]|uniref:polysaccharide pyruvyl transferase family protein n=1 Tax=Arthrobacter sp. 08Y14 TaxID=2058885 RepID=UPI000CE3A8E0|nr:polysaccharide pyruvyl transferase family protein [Arthrobacter sp. 08Y14]